MRKNFVMAIICIGSLLLIAGCGKKENDNVEKGSRNNIVEETLDETKAVVEDSTEEETEVPVEDFKSEEYWLNKSIEMKTDDDDKYSIQLGEFLLTPKTTFGELFDYLNTNTPYCSTENTDLFVEPESFYGVKLRTGDEYFSDENCFIRIGVHNITSKAVKLRELTVSDILVSGKVVIPVYYRKYCIGNKVFATHFDTKDECEAVVSKLNDDKDIDIWYLEVRFDKETGKYYMGVREEFYDGDYLSWRFGYLVNRQ